jgi:hypothetical protein
MGKPVVELGPAIDRYSAATRTADRFDKVHTLACSQISPRTRILTKPC